MKKNCRVLLAISLATICAFSACKPETEGQNDENVELFVALENTKIERFSSFELELCEDVDQVTWSSSNTDVAVIDDGVLIGLKAGTTTISAKVGEKTQEQTITVVENGTLPTIDVDYLPVLLGNGYEMDAQAYFNGKQLDDVTFTYSVADTAIADVEGNVLSGVSCGETTVTISLSWRGQTNVVIKTVPCEVVRNVAVYTDKVEYLLYTMDSVLGASFETQTQIETTVYYENAKVDGLSFTWISGDENVATIDDNGCVQAVSYGETYVLGTCRYNDETLSTRKVPIKVEKPYLKTTVDVPVKIGSKNVEIDAEKALGEGYSIGKIANLDTGFTYEYTDNGVDLSNVSVGEYSFIVYEQDESFATEVNVIVADYVVTNSEELLEATAALNAYVVLANDINVGKYTTPKNASTHLSSGTFNGLGHTIEIEYAKRSLYGYVGSMVFKNLSVVCTAYKSNSGALFYHGNGEISVENCYLETTIQYDDSNCVGGVCDYLSKKSSLTLTNSLVKVNGLDRTSSVQKECGGVAVRVYATFVKFINSYVIANGTLAGEYSSTDKTIAVNQQTGVLYEDVAAFVEAKEKGDVILNTFNTYWDLTGEIPVLKPMV